MRTYTSDTAKLTDEYGIQIGRWSQYANLDKLPFDAMWCVIPPGGRSDEDHHPEVEFAVVAQGRAVYESGGERVEVPTGGVILLEPHQRHVIHNARADEPLTILSIYWVPGDSTGVGEQAPRSESHGDGDEL